MSYRLWVEDEAKAEVKRLPGHMRQRMRRAIRDLADEPRPHNSREMSRPEGVTLDVELRRLRLERWRAIYIVDEEWHEVGVLAVRKRPPYDYEDLVALLRRLG